MLVLLGSEHIQGGVVHPHPCYPTPPAPFAGQIFGSRVCTANALALPPTHFLQQFDTCRTSLFWYHKPKSGCTVGCFSRICFWACEGLPLKLCTSDFLCKTLSYNEHAVLVLHAKCLLRKAVLRLQELQDEMTQMTTVDTFDMITQGVLTRYFLVLEGDSGMGQYTGYGTVKRGVSQLSLL